MNDYIILILLFLYFDVGIVFLFIDSAKYRGTNAKRELMSFFLWPRFIFKRGVFK